MAWIVRRQAWSKLVISTVLVMYSAVVQADTNFSFLPHFPCPNGNGTPKITIEADAVCTNGKSTINPDSAGSDSSVPGACGRVLYKDKIRMVDEVARTAASFHTSFTFSFEATDNRSCGDGMVFSFYQGNSIGTDQNLSGGGFCAVNFNQPRGVFQFSVEIDSHYNDEGSRGSNDVSDSHIGVNFGNENVSSRYDLCNSSIGHCNTVYDLCKNTTVDMSTADMTKTATNRCYYFCDNPSRNYTLWIDYDGEGHKLEVWFSTDESLSTGTRKPAQAKITVPNLRLNEFLLEEMYVGFTASTGVVREKHVLKSWYFVSTGMPDVAIAPTTPDVVIAPTTPDVVIAPTTPDVVIAPTTPDVVIAPTNRKRNFSIIASVCAAAAVATVGLLWFVCKKSRRSRPHKNQEMVSYLRASDNLRMFTYGEISSSTKNFSASEFLSSGSFGDVYRGVLPSGAVVAVKRIKENQSRGEETFLAEATSLRQIRHRNLVQLRGWSHHREELFLVYDYMSNGSLDKWIHQSEPDRFLSWNVRRSILAGVAAGLEYLHTGWVQCVLHRDIKASNVLLDADFNAYLGDFGLARLVDHHKLEKTTLLAGTLGYMAPEMQFTGKATKETDVYAFGILVLEVVCGRRPLNVQLTDDEASDIVLLESVWRSHEAGNVLRVADTRLFDDHSSDTFVDRMIIVNVLHLGLLCCLPNPSERPSMRVVSQWFQACEVGAMDQLPPLPATKPQLYQYSDTTASQSDPSGGSSTSLSSGSWGSLSAPQTSIH